MNMRDIAGKAENNKEKLAVAVISVLFLGWIIIQDHQQKRETEQQLTQINTALNRLNTALEQSNTLQARQVSLGEQSTGMLVDTRNAVLEMNARQDTTSLMNQSRVQGGPQ